LVERFKDSGQVPLMSAF